jgi:transcriptional regulator with XRE-family HTH domain
MQPMLLGKRIRELREREGMSQVALARTLGASINAINMLEVGSTRAPHIDRLIAIADLFHVSIDYLVGRTDAPEPVPGKPTAKRQRTRKAAAVG